MKVRLTRHARSEAHRLGKAVGFTPAKVVQYLNNRARDIEVCTAPHVVVHIATLPNTITLDDGSTGNWVMAVVDNKRQDRTYGNIVTVYLAQDYQVETRSSLGGHNGHCNDYI